MSWWAATPAILSALGVLFVPGLIVLLPATRWSFQTLALAPAVSVGTIAIAAVLGGFLGIEWSGWVPVALATVLAAIVVMIRWLRRGSGGPSRWEPSWPARRWALAGIGSLIGVLLLGGRLMLAISDVESISQTFDNIFHLNAVRYVLDHGSASTFDVGSMTGLVYYPAGWHGVVALVAQLSGASVPVATNAATMALMAVWVLGMVGLVGTLFPRKAWMLVVAGVISASFGAFPFLMLSFGTLYPNCLAIALLPAVLTATLRLLRLPPEEAVPTAPLPIAIPLVLLGLAGVALAHPNGVAAWLAMAWPFFVWRAWTQVQAIRSSGDAGSRRRIVTILGSVVAGLALSAVIWKFLRPPEAAVRWEPVESVAQAFGESLFGSYIGRPVSWVLALLIVFGLVYAVRRPINLWVCGPFIVMSFMYVIGLGMQYGDFRTWFTGVWYNDPFRIAALMPIGTIVVACLGVVAVVDVVRWALRHEIALRLPPKVLAAAPVVLVVLGSLILLLGAQRGNIVRHEREVANSFESEMLLSRDERALIERLPENVPEDSLILTNPWAGGSLAYALTGIDVTEKHAFAKVDDDFMFLDESISNIDSDPAVCEAVRDTGVDYVLAFGDFYVNGGMGMTIDYEGLLVGPGEHLKLVDSQGVVALYAIVGCDE